MQAKWLRQQLTHLSWLGVACLVLGWAEGAAAQDLALSVNPASVREDAASTNLEVTVEVTDDIAVSSDTYVLLSIAQNQQGLNSRFNIQLAVLRILAGTKKATGTITLIPINNSIVDDDLPIEISGNAGVMTVAPTTITLIDDDKPSTKISLAADITELNRFDDATEITVTATLDGRDLTQALSLALIIGDHPNLGATPNADTNGDGTIDNADATKDNREAQRDVDYTVTLATLTIPSDSVSGTATITITPRSQLPGTIRVEGIGGELPIDPVDIKIKKEGTARPSAIALSQNSIREDAGETAIELRVALTNALIRDETVRLVILPNGAVLPSGHTVAGTPIRDVHYRLSFGAPLTIPAGATEGTTTFTLTPTNDTAVATRDSIYIQVTVGSVEAVKAIAIVDDDASSKTISLTVNPTSISEKAGSTDIAVIGTLDGKVLDEDVVVLLTVDPVANEAVRDVDYTATLRPLIIAAGAVSGTTTITIRPVADNIEDDGEKIRLIVPYANRQIITASGTLTVGSVDITLKDTGVDSVPSFAGVSIAAQTYAAGAPIADWVLPTAVGGEAPLTYSVSALPAGLAFDAATRTLAGTPMQATDGAVAIIYTATDSNGDAATLTFLVAVDPAAEATELAFAPGASVAAQTYTLGVPIADLVLPEATAPDCHPAYSVSVLPAGLWFNSATRTLAGTPTQATDGVVAVEYTATDIETGASVSLVFAITVAPVGSIVATGLTAMPAEISEAAEETAIVLTVALAAASATAENVRFAIVELSDDALAVPAAMRDVDYRAELQAQIAIPAGATEATATLTLTPINDNTEEGREVVGVQATIASTGQTLTTAILIQDDDAPSTSIALSAAPSTLSEDASLTSIAVTATLDGKPLLEDAIVSLAIDDASTATRDLDYRALFTPRIEIPAGSTTGTRNIYVDPLIDNLAEGDEIIRLIGTVDGLEEGSVEIVLSDAGAAKGVVLAWPQAFALVDNYPNPFNPTTTIQYALPQAADVELVVYNMVGQVVRTLVAEHQSAGHYAVEWDATADSGRRLSSGLYFYRLQAGAFRETKRMLLLK